MDTKNKVELIVRGEEGNATYRYSRRGTAA
jgi:hypothetical protein